MILEDLLNLGVNQIKEIITMYLQESPQYRLKNNFEKYIENLVMCVNCGEAVSKDNLSDNDFITEGGRINICNDCINDGYGR